ncbi:hypothetical protein QLQ15_15295 [Lysobacter sp. LF1]|uniref:Type II secretion system protein n=1 Tax=Lysobacter stagni TaxID=3045172 RepID=A0ABT6XJM2_9GAMM|nr:hypothetical protein [Lysobacter sp. LF1]MDI9240274.1 hypothetical protein [Lysobacter sp. LF1]
MVATVVAAVVVMGTPQMQRRARQDERRLEDLRRIVMLTQMVAATHGSVPDDLDAIAKQPGRPTTRDPFTGAPYEYVVLDARHYRLCATFQTDSASGVGRRRTFEIPWPDPEWQHPAGRHCFDRVIKRND